MLSADEVYDDATTSPCEEHDWDGGYPYRECMRCGLVAEAPEPDYGDPRGEDV